MLYKNFTTSHLVLLALFSLACLFFCCGPSPTPVAPEVSVKPETKPEQFLFGASVYPELQTRDQWNRMLDAFQEARINVVRVTESSWGNLETAPGEYDFGWIHEFLDDVQQHNMKAILGTSTYIAPQWLAAKNPEVLVQSVPGLKIHPMARKAACVNHPLYRAACQRYIGAIGAEFKDHPTVIGWQLDNEIENSLTHPDHNPAALDAWHDWLAATYGSPEEFNERLFLASWGMKVTSFEEIPMPGETIEGFRKLPALQLAYLHFRRDVILDFFAEQTRTLRKAGVKHWIMTDWNARWEAVADDSRAKESLDIAGLNFYQPSTERPEFWTDLAWHLDMHRSAHGLNHFLVTETRIGVAGGTTMGSPFPSQDQWRMWMLQPVAYGASSIIYWTGNRWRGGHWPHWGGLLDWSGKPEPDFEWAVQLGGFLKKWSGSLLDNPVQAQAVVLTDFDQRAALMAYPHTPSSRSVLRESVDALHRLGIGVDTINGKDAADVENLKRYSLVVLPAATALDGKAVPEALEQFAAQGGHVLITPFTAYQDWDGIFRGDGFGANLSKLTGTLVRTARRMGTAKEDDAWPAGHHVKWNKSGIDGLSPVGIDGYCEYMEVSEDADVIARFESDEPLLDGKPAVTEKKIGKGSVIKLAFWPTDDSVARLVGGLVSTPGNPLSEIVPPGVQAVPRTDGTMFVINTTNRPATIKLAKTVTDRISSKKLSGKVEMRSYGVLWLQ